MALGREGVRHNVIGPKTLHRACTAAHMDEFKRSFVDPGARVAVASVNTLVSMSPDTPWFKQVGLWIQDEAHHVLADNQWGRAALLFPNARGLGVTATPCRADGKGLGRHADGLFDQMVVGPSMRELIRRGYLTDYDVACPPSDIDLSNVPTTASGEFSPAPLAAARKRSHITGDVVKHYLKFARGKLGVTFDTDIESATETAQAYRAAGVPAEIITGTTPDAVRRSLMRRFRAREILQLVNVDLLGEGVDVPAIEVVSMARPTQSYSLYCQQLGRALRPMEGKTRALVLDHVGNVLRHGLPDAPRTWSLDRRERRNRSSPTDVVPIRTCRNTECLMVYERVLVACPFCGHEPVPADRSSPERVEGDLTLLDPAVLAKLRGDIHRVDDAPLIPYGMPTIGQMALRKRHAATQEAQDTLRDLIALWAGWQKHQGRTDRECYKRFYSEFGVDVISAQALSHGDASALAARIQDVLNVKGVTKI